MGLVGVSLFTTNKFSFCLNISERETFKINVSFSIKSLEAEVNYVRPFL